MTPETSPLMDWCGTCHRRRRRHSNPARLHPPARLSMASSGSAATKTRYSPSRDTSKVLFVPKEITMNQKILKSILLCATLIAALISTYTPFAQGQTTPVETAGKTRTYYIAADEVNWDYVPLGRDEAMGHPFDEVGKVYTESGPHRIGRVYRKAIYREYTDASFSTLKARPSDQQYLGLMGPILRGEVGDTIKVVFRNNASHPYSMHPHGVTYAKDSEGADYNDGTSGADKEDGGVPPGGTHTYVWQLPERAGPGPNDPSSVFWLYHSHCDEIRDVASGLFGGMVVTRAGMALPDGRPKDVD